MKREEPAEALAVERRLEELFERGRAICRLPEVVRRRALARARDAVVQGRRR